MDRKIENFLYLVLRLDPLEFAGLATFFGFNPDQDFEELLQLITNRFAGLRRKKRKEIMQMLREVVNANKEK